MIEDMRRRIVLIEWGLLATAVLWVLFSIPRMIFAQGNGSAQITSPKTGDSLFGVVPILGTASNPNMMRYSLDFDLQDEPTDRWLPIAGPVTQQVTNGVLGQWDTSKLQGRYQIRLRVTLRNGTVLDAIVQNLMVNNVQPTALPTVLPSATPAPPTPLATPGPSPTSQIQQPPTPTVRALQPTDIPAPTDLPAADTQSQPLGVINLEALQSAFCSGVYIAVFGFAVLGVYGLIHPRMRRFVNRLRDDMRR